MLQHSGMLYFCHTSNSMRYKKPLDQAKLFSHRPASTLTTPLQDWSTPSPLLLLLEVPFPVDCCCSCTALLVSTKRTAALPWQGPDHCSRTCSLTHHQCHRNILVAVVICIATFWLPSSSTSQYFGCYHHLHRNILVAIVIYIATFSLPKSFDYSGRAIQVHTQERAIQVHGKTCPTSQLTADFAPFGTCLPLWRS